MSYRSLALLMLIAAWLPSSAQAQDTVKVAMKDFMFAPTTVTVNVGAKVTWVNLDDEPHTVVSDTGTFRSAAMDSNESFSFKFTAPGTYHFTCSIHPRMVGTIIVK
jgi:plastocyanin